MVVKILIMYEIKHIAVASLCSENENNKFCCNGGSLGLLARYLTKIHNLQMIFNLSKLKRYFCTYF